MASIGVQIVPVVATAHEFKAGDRVLIAIRTDVTPDQMAVVRDALHDKFPDVQFTFLAGASVEGVQST